MGEKEPLENKDMTSGICPECFPGELEKIRKLREKNENGGISGGLGRNST